MSPPLVLIVEDTDDSRELLSDLLLSHGYRTRTARNGIEGLAELETEPPDVVLLDLMMPVMDGWQFREALGKHPHRSATPVIVVSAVVDRQRLPPDIAAFLPKPLEIEDVLRAVDRVCKPA